MEWVEGLVSNAVRVTRLLSLSAVLFNALAHLLAQRAAHLLRRLDRLGLRGLLSDFFRDDFFGFETEVFAHPAAHLFSDLGESLHRRQPGCPILAHGHRAHGADRPKILARRGRRRLVVVRKHFLADETELGQVIAQCLQFDGGLAFVRIGDAAGQQIGVIGEDLDALATSRDWTEEGSGMTIDACSQ